MDFEIIVKMEWLNLCSEIIAEWNSKRLNNIVSLSD